MAQNQIIKDDNKYISISKAFSSSLVERDSASTSLNSFVAIDKVAELKGLKSNSSIRKSINNNKYIARQIPVKGGYTYEILISSLELELQAQILDEEIKSTQLIPLNNNQNTFIAEKRKVEALAKIDLINNFKKFSLNYKKKKDSIKNFLELYNTGLYLKEVFKILNTVSRSSLLSWIKIYEENGNVECLISKYKYSKKGEYNTCLTEEMQQIFLKFLLHPHQFNIGKAIHLTIQYLKMNNFENIPSDMTFRRFALNYKFNNYDKWILCREGEKAFNDKVEPYIKRDISVLNVGDVIIADGHVLNFEVLNPYTNKPCRATLVGFLDWKSTALIGYEIMVSENTQCIASALRNSILNLGRIPKVVYQDNGRAFRAKYFQHCNFDEIGFNGVYANLGIKPVFAQVRNAKAKVIERFFREFQDEFEKMMPSYIGTGVLDKPARLRRGEILHKEFHKKFTDNYIPTIQETIKCIDCWLKYHNSKTCPNDKSKTIQEVLNTVQREQIDKNKLNDLMMKSEIKSIQRNGIRFLGEDYYNETLFGYREPVYIRYSLFDLSQVHVYTLKGEFICVAKRVEKTHPMANHLGTVTDMQDFKQKIEKQKKRKNKAVKEFRKYYDIELTGILEIEKTPVVKIEEYQEPKPKRERKLTPREQQMNRPIFNHDYEKYEWLITHGTTNQEDRKWLENYIKSEEYNNLYGD